MPTSLRPSRRTRRSFSVTRENQGERKLFQLFGKASFLWRWSGTIYFWRQGRKNGRNKWHTVSEIQELCGGGEHLWWELGRALGDRRTELLGVVVVGLVTQGKVLHGSSDLQSVAICEA